MEKIIILDFGGQYTQLIAKKVRECGVFSEIKDYKYKFKDLENIKGIILSGGPSSVYEKDSPKIDKNVLNMGIPVLGICYGMQQIIHLFNGKMCSGIKVIKEYGKTEIISKDNNLLFSEIPTKINVWMSHGDSIDENTLPKNFEIISRTKDHIASVFNKKRNLYGIQFHPEVSHTEYGIELIANFVKKICKCSSNWNMSDHIEQCKHEIRKKVGKNNIICFVSGGVDSVYVASILANTTGIGKVYAVYINALMRKNETDEVKQTLKNAGLKDLIIYDAEKEFIDKLKNISEPEEKRKIIGNLFGTIMNRIIQELNLNEETTFLAQGTLYTDLIESGKGVGKKAANIKSHHNVGCEFIEKLKKKNKIIEPNKLMFKDEVRIAAKKIGLPEVIYNRQPFPGPGLGIRIVNSSKKWINEKFHQTDHKVFELAKKYNYNAYLLPIKTVGVQGDKRTYSYTVILDGERNTKKISILTKQITSNIHNVNRVVFNITDRVINRDSICKPIETYISKETIDILKNVDSSSTNIIKKYGLYNNISQTIFILFGIDIYNTQKRTIALRAVITDDFMTVSPVEPMNIKKENISVNKDIKMTWECLDEINDHITTNYNVGGFVIDVTEKPPATTCWE